MLMLSCLQVILSACPVCQALLRSNPSPFLLHLQAASSTSASGGSHWPGSLRRLCVMVSSSGCPCCWTALSLATSTASLQSRPLVSHLILCHPSFSATPKRISWARLTLLSNLVASGCPVHDSKVARLCQSQRTPRRRRGTVPSWR